MRLADGNQASVGDVIITRTNDRRLRLTATDWVKNGDRWTITAVSNDGGLTVRHNRSHLSVRLPCDYVCTSTGLGYATTIHAAQGVSADTMHGLITGQESRQQLYTMLTRGRAANHLYLQVVGDGDPHTIIRPETVAPRTPTETLQQILVRDDATPPPPARCCEKSGPSCPAFDAVQRYTDGLHVAAEQLVAPQIVQMLDSQADQVVPELTSEPSWPTLERISSPWRLKPVSTTPPPAHSRRRTGTHTAAEWPPCWTGASQSPHLPTPDRCPGFPVPEALHDHPFGAHLANAPG